MAAQFGSQGLDSAVQAAMQYGSPAQSWAALDDLLLKAWLPFPGCSAEQFKHTLNSGLAVCGHVFRAGDMVFNCKVCSVDPTCVLCSKCFDPAKHEGHDVSCYRSQGSGGCCDCGDSSAWAPAGMCDAHNPLKNQSSEEDAFLSWPPGLAQHAGAVISAALRAAVVGARTQALTLCAGMQPVPGRLNAASTLRSADLVSLPAMSPSQQVHIMLHDDDVHTYEQVTRALQDAGLPHDVAAQITEATDRAGLGKLPPCTWASAVPKLLHLARAGLWVSVSTEADLHAVQTGSVAAQWLDQLCEVAGFRLLVARAMQEPPPAPAASELSRTLFDNPERWPALASCMRTLMGQDLLLERDMAKAMHSLYMKMNAVECVRQHMALCLGSCLSSLVQGWACGAGIKRDCIWDISVHVFTVPQAVLPMIFSQPRDPASRGAAGSVEVDILGEVAAAMSALAATTYTRDLHVYCMQPEGTGMAPDVIVPARAHDVQAAAASGHLARRAAGNALAAWPADPAGSQLLAAAAVEAGQALRAEAGDPSLADAVLTALRSCMDAQHPHFQFERSSAPYHPIEYIVRVAGAAGTALQRLDVMGSMALLAGGFTLADPLHRKRGSHVLRENLLWASTLDCSLVLQSMLYQVSLAYAQQQSELSPLEWQAGAPVMSAALQYWISALLTRTYALCVLTAGEQDPSGAGRLQLAPHLVLANRLDDARTLHMPCFRLGIDCATSFHTGIGAMLGRASSALLPVLEAAGQLPHAVGQLARVLRQQAAEFLPTSALAPGAQVAPPVYAAMSLCLEMLLTSRSVRANLWRRNGQGVLEAASHARRLPFAHSLFIASARVVQLSLAAGLHGLDDDELDAQASRLLVMICTAGVPARSSLPPSGSANDSITPRLPAPHVLTPLSRALLYGTALHRCNEADADALAGMAAGVLNVLINLVCELPESLGAAATPGNPLHSAHRAIARRHIVHQLAAGPQLRSKLAVSVRDVVDDLAGHAKDSLVSSILEEVAVKREGSVDGTKWVLRPELLPSICLEYPFSGNKISSAARELWLESRAGGMPAECKAWLNAPNPAAVPQDALDAGLAAARPLGTPLPAAMSELQRVRWLCLCQAAARAFRVSLHSAMLQQAERAAAAAVPGVVPSAAMAAFASAALPSVQQLEQVVRLVTIALHLASAADAPRQLIRAWLDAALADEAASDVVPEVAALGAIGCIDQSGPAARATLPRLRSLPVYLAHLAQGGPMAEFVPADASDMPPAAPHVREAAAWCLHALAQLRPDAHEAVHAALGYSSRTASAAAAAAAASGRGKKVKKSKKAGKKALASLQAAQAAFLDEMGDGSSDEGDALGVPAHVAASADLAEAAQRKLGRRCQPLPTWLTAVPSMSSSLLVGMCRTAQHIIEHASPAVASTAAAIAAAWLEAASAPLAIHASVEHCAARCALLGDVDQMKQLGLSWYAVSNSQDGPVCALCQQVAGPDEPLVQLAYLSRQTSHVELPQLHSDMAHTLMPAVQRALQRWGLLFQLGNTPDGSAATIAVDPQLSATALAAQKQAWALLGMQPDEAVADAPAVGSALAPAHPAASDPLLQAMQSQLHLDAAGGDDASSMGEFSLYSDEEVGYALPADAMQGPGMVDDGDALDLDDSDYESVHSSTDSEVIDEDTLADDDDDDDDDEEEEDDDDSEDTDMTSDSEGFGEDGGMGFDANALLQQLQDVLPGDLDPMMLAAALGGGQQTGAMRNLLSALGQQARPQVPVQDILRLASPELQLRVLAGHRCVPRLQTSRTVLHGACYLKAKQSSGTDQSARLLFQNGADFLDPLTRRLANAYVNVPELGDSHVTTRFFAACNALLSVLSAYCWAGGNGLSSNRDACILLCAACHCTGIEPSEEVVLGAGLPAGAAPRVAGLDGLRELRALVPGTSPAVFDVVTRLLTGAYGLGAVIVPQLLTRASALFSQSAQSAARSAELPAPLREFMTLVQEVAGTSLSSAHSTVGYTRFTKTLHALYAPKQTQHAQVEQAAPQMCVVDALLPGQKRSRSPSGTTELELEHQVQAAAASVPQRDEATASNSQGPASERKPGQLEALSAVAAELAAAATLPGVPMEEGIIAAQRQWVGMAAMLHSLAGSLCTGVSLHVLASGLHKLAQQGVTSVDDCFVSPADAPAPQVRLLTRIFAWLTWPAGHSLEQHPLQSHHSVLLVDCDPVRVVVLAVMLRLPHAWRDKLAAKLLAAHATAHQAALPRQAVPVGARAALSAQEAFPLLTSALLTTLPAQQRGAVLQQLAQGPAEQLESLHSVLELACPCFYATAATMGMCPAGARPEAALASAELAPLLQAAAQLHLTAGAQVLFSLNGVALQRAGFGASVAASELSIVRQPSTRPALVDLPHAFVDLVDAIAGRTIPLAVQASASQAWHSLWSSMAHVSSAAQVPSLGGAAPRHAAIDLISGTIIPYKAVQALQGNGIDVFTRAVHYGVGVWLLCDSSSVLLVNGKFVASYGSPYVDKHGEPDQWLSRGLPLYLDHDRYVALQRLWLSGGVPQEVLRRRQSSDRVTQLGVM